MGKNYTIGMNLNLLSRFSKKIHISNRVLIPILVVLIFSSLIIFLYERKREKNKESVNQHLITVEYLSDSEKKQDPLLRDSDSDGVYDWKEELLGLDPHNPDTDRDGVSDLEYVRSIESFHSSSNKQGGGKDLTLSERFGRGVYTAIYLLEKSNDGQPLDEQTKKKIEKNVEDYIKTVHFGEKLYTRDSIKVIEDSKQNDFAYEEKMKQLFNEYPIKLSDFDLLRKSVGKEEQYRVQLTNAVMRYDDYLHELEQVKVPALAVQKHLQLMNGVVKLKTALANVDNVDDGLIVVSALSQFSQLVEDVLDAIIKLNKYFQIIHEPDAFA